MTVLDATGPPRSLSAWLDGRGSLRALVTLRMAVGPLVALHLRPFLADAAAGRIYSDTFTMPYVSWYPGLPRQAYIALLWVTLLSAMFVSIGLATRPAAIVTFAGVAYNFFASVTHFHHNRAFLLILLAGVAALPVGRWVSIDNLLRRRRGEAAPGDAALWPLALLRFEVAVAYWASGLSKAIDQDWWGGLVTRLRIEQYGDLAASRGTPDWLLDLLATHGFHWWFAKIVVLTELTIGLGLFWRRTRLLSIWLAIGFHFAIEISASVQVFSAAGFAALVIWITPRDHDRTVLFRPDDPRARRFAAAVRLLDWTGRFRVEPAQRGAPLRLTDRPHRGSEVEYHGREAAVTILSRLPATFWFAAPLLGWRRRSEET
jgi:hypothetical protein